MDDIMPPKQQPNQTPTSEPTEQPTQTDTATPVTSPTQETSTEEPTTPQVVGSNDQVSSSLDKKPSWSRRIVFIVVILALLGGAIWAAMNINKPNKPAVTTVTKKDVALVHVGIQEPVLTTLYPGIEGNNIDYDINNQVFEGLTKFQDKTRVVPALATSWSNPDTSTWVFKLRQGVKFHDGNAMTAQSVKDSLDATQGNDVLGEFNSTIKTVTVVDPTTVKITTTAPDPLLLNKLTYLNIFDTKGKANDAANGTGPYTLKPGSQPSANGIQLVAFSGYYGGTVNVKEVDYVYYADDQAVLKDLQQNKLDIGFLTDQSLIAKAGTSFKQFVPENPTVSFMVPNTLEAGPLANKTVRQAIYTALDPAALAKSRGITAAPATQPVPAAIPGYNPAIKRPTTDTAKAKALLTQAGYPNGFAIKLSYFTNSKNIALELQKELAAVGITLNLDEQSSGRTLQQIAYGGKTDSYFVSNTSDLIDSSDVFDTLVFQQKNYNNPTLTKLNNEAGTTLDASKRLKLLQQMNDTIMSDYGVFPLYETGGHTMAVRSDLHLDQQNLNSYSGLLYSKVYGE